MVKKVKVSKLLKKPSAKLSSYSPTKFVSQLADQQGALVRDVPNPYADPVQDNRSLFFKEEYRKEKQKRFGGFI
jgi:hypothetical protein